MIDKFTSILKFILLKLAILFWNSEWFPDREILKASKIMLLNTHREIFQILWFSFTEAATVIVRFYASFYDHCFLTNFTSIYPNKGQISVAVKYCYWCFRLIREHGYIFTVPCLYLPIFLVNQQTSAYHHVSCSSYHYHFPVTFLGICLK